MMRTTSYGNATHAGLSRMNVVVKKTTSILVVGGVFENP
jgi:molybdopterin biosynthesis enzyme MoaB